jgi:pilus assembly protein CpaB
VSARRTLIIIVALAVGAVAAIVTVLYVNSAQSRANNNAKLVAVYVISRDIPKNSTGDSAISNGAIQRSSIPRKFYPNTAVTNVSEIKGKITPTELVPGQILVENEFVEPSVASTSFSGTELQAGEVAITVTLPPANAAGGLVVPGDLIDLLRITTPQAAGAAAGSGTTNPATSIAHFFYQNVKVIAIGAQAAPTPGQTQTPTAGASALFTLAVPPEAAERILLAASQGTIFAALVPPNNQPVNIPAVQGQNVDSTNPVLAGPPALTPEGSS